MKTKRLHGTIFLPSISRGTMKGKNITSGKWKKATFLDNWGFTIGVYIFWFIFVILAIIRRSDADVFVFWLITALSFPILVVSVAQSIHNSRKNWEYMFVNKLPDEIYGRITGMLKKRGIKFQCNTSCYHGTGTISLKRGGIEIHIEALRHKTTGSIFSEVSISYDSHNIRKEEVNSIKKIIMEACID